MPFHESVYYPYPYPGPETQGTRSSAGIPSLLNSPLSRPSSSNGHHPAAMTPSPFRFCARRESVDWRRVGALDVERVASEVDVDTLQQHVAAVAFCSLEGERCQRCHAPVDPALAKLFRLAQLTVEWLLHSQGLLAEHLRAAEERLAAGSADREQLLARHGKLEEKVRALSDELKQRKKIIRTQQSILVPSLVSGQKCPHCDKTFMNSSFLDRHIQRRHTEESETKSRSDSEKKSQIDSLKVEIDGLKEQLVQQQHALLAKTAQEKEQESLHRDVVRELERFKAEELTRMDRKIEDSRDGMRREIEFFYTRNFQARIESEQSQAVRREAADSPVQRQAERDTDDGYKDTQMRALQKLEQQLKKQLKKQDRKWESRMQDNKNQHESEKNELLREMSRMQASVAEQQGKTQRVKDDLERRLQERDHTINTQRELIKSLSSQPPTRTVEVPVIATAPAPEPKPKRVVREEPPSAPKLDPIQEQSEEEERDSSSVSEKKPADKKPEVALERKERRAASALWRNPSIKKELMPVLRQAVVEKLQTLGVRPEQSGLKDEELTTIMSRVDTERESVARNVPEYCRCREELVRSLEKSLQQRRRGSDPPAPGPRPRTLTTVSQSRPRCSILPSRVTQVMSGPAAKHTPQPAPRTRPTDLPKTSTPNSRTTVKASTLKTPNFSSDEETEEEEEEKRGGPSPRPDRAPVLQNHASRPSPTLGRQTPARPSVTSAPTNQQRGPAAVTALQSDDDWSDGSVLQEIDPKTVPGKKDTVMELGRKVERQISERVVKRPAGGVSVLPEKEDVVQDLQYTDLEESSDWAVSSMEEGNVPALSGAGQGASLTRKSLDSPSTSVWGSSTGRGQKPGLADGTLKSSLVSLSDFSDSDEI